MRDDRGLDAVRGLSMDVRAGEIVGIAGVDGNGQSELIQALAGMRVAARRAHRPARRRRDARESPRESSEAGVGHIPEDRQRHGLVLDFSIAENSALHDYDEPPISRTRPGSTAMPWSTRARPSGSASTTCAAAARATPARALSGGNQQKVVLAREIQSNPRLLIAAQPTRGLDVGAIEYVHRRLVEQRDAGCAVLLVSFELDEVMDLADRILVMFGGRDRARARERPTDERELGVAMTGGKVPA